MCAGKLVACGSASSRSRRSNRAKLTRSGPADLPRIARTPFPRHQPLLLMKPVTAPERIGLFGGSFDPVHYGHLLVAQAACEELALSRLFFIPAAQSPFKPEANPSPAALRLRLLGPGTLSYSRIRILYSEY